MKPLPSGLDGSAGVAMDEVTVVLVVCLLIAILVRLFWRLVLNILVIVGISLIVAGIFVIVRVLEQVNDWA